jgi:Bacterial Ig-like domain
VTSYEDVNADHGRLYRYAIAGMGPDNAQGLESRGDEAIADALGPRVVAVYPTPGTSGVGPGQAISVRFDENVVKESVSQGAIRLIVDGHTVQGFVLRKFPRLIKFNPSRPLKKGKVYTAIVEHGLQDQLGNEGERYVWRFRTEEPRRKRSGRR